jgi:hypothetical protein
MPELTLSQVVARGIALLDGKGPADWRLAIDTEYLNMSGFFTCVLGSIFGSFNDGLTALDISHYYGTEAFDYGFDTEPGSYWRLTDEWIRQLTNFTTSISVAQRSFTMPELTLSQVVARGIALMDGMGPDGWRSTVSENYFDMSSLYDCVLGKVFGGYTDGCITLGVSLTPYNTEQYDYGFDCARGSWTYMKLTAEWIQQLSTTAAVSA